MLLLIIFDRVSSGQHGDPDTTLIILDSQELYQTDLSGILHMGSAAGAGIVSADPYDPHLTSELFFAAIIDLLQLFPAGIENLDLDIFFDDFIDLTFKFRQLLRDDDAVEIQRHCVASHMKAYIIITIFRVDQSGKNMLSTVVLHVSQTFVPVQAT